MHLIAQYHGIIIINTEAIFKTHDLLTCLCTIQSILFPIFYPVNLQYSSCKHVFSTNVETVLILIKQLCQKPSVLDILCFQNRVNLDSA